MSQKWLERNQTKRMITLAVYTVVHRLIVREVTQKAKHVSSKMVGRGGRKAQRLSLTRMAALFPLFWLRFLHRGRGAQTKGSDAVFVNKALALMNLMESPVSDVRRRSLFLKVCVFRKQ